MSQDVCLVSFASAFSLYVYFQIYIHTNILWVPEMKSEILCPFTAKYLCVFVLITRHSLFSKNRDFCVCEHGCAVAMEPRRRLPDPLDLEVQEFMSHAVCAGIWALAFWSSSKCSCLLNNFFSTQIKFFSYLTITFWRGQYWGSAWASHMLSMWSTTELHPQKNFLSNYNDPGQD